MQIYYHTRNEMAPRLGNSFGTIYYKLAPKELSKLKKHVQSVLLELAMEYGKDPVANEWLNDPYPGNFKRTKGKPNYSMLEIVTDLDGQLNDQKDITQGMLGRWQRMFKDTEWDFQLLPRRKVSKAEAMFLTKHKLFKETRDE